MRGMYYGMGEEAKKEEENPWKVYFRNLTQNAITGLVSNIPAIRPPAASTAPAPAATTPTSAIATATSAAKSTWPILAVGGAGVLGLVAVLMLKKKR